MKFVATKTVDQLDLQALHRVRERLVSQRTGIINQIRAFLLERGIAVRRGLRPLRVELPRILATRSDVLSPRMSRLVEDLARDWRRLDARVEGLSLEIEAPAQQDQACVRLMTVPGIGPISSSAMVALIHRIESKPQGEHPFQRDTCTSLTSGILNDLFQKASSGPYSRSQRYGVFPMVGIQFASRPDGAFGPKYRSMLPSAFIFIWSLLNEPSPARSSGF
jgi:hypothetical protein